MAHNERDFCNGFQSTQYVHRAFLNQQFKYKYFHTRTVLENLQMKRAYCILFKAELQ